MSVQACVVRGVPGVTPHVGHTQVAPVRAGSPRFLPGVRASAQCEAAGRACSGGEKEGVCGDSPVPRDLSHHGDTQQVPRWSSDPAEGPKRWGGGHGGVPVPPCPWWLLRAERCSAPAPFPSPAPSSHRHQGTLKALNIQFPSPSPPCKGVQHGNEPRALHRRDLSGRRLLRASLPQKSPEVATGAAGAHPHGFMPPSPLLSCPSPCCNTGFSPLHISPQAWIRPEGVPVPPGSRDSGDRWMAAGRGGCRSEAGTASCRLRAQRLQPGYGEARR